MYDFLSKEKKALFPEKALLPLDNEIVTVYL
jgi:hypothetical protein